MSLGPEKQTPAEAAAELGEATDSHRVAKYASQLVRRTTTVRI